VGAALRLLLLSNSTCEGRGYLEHARPALGDLLRDKATRLLFVPYAAWVAFASLLNAAIVYLN